MTTVSYYCIAFGPKHLSPFSQQCLLILLQSLKSKARNDLFDIELLCLYLFSFILNLPQVPVRLEPTQTYAFVLCPMKWAGRIPVICSPSWPGMM